jgi:hypothetical protein
MYLITFIKKFFHSHYNKYVEIFKLFPTKTAYYVKRQKISKIFFEKLAFYGLDMELEPEPVSKVGTRTGTITFSKVGTGTITFQKSEPDSEPEP